MLKHFDQIKLHCIPRYVSQPSLEWRKLSNQIVSFVKCRDQRHDQSVEFDVLPFNLTDPY